MNADSILHFADSNAAVASSSESDSLHLAVGFGVLLDFFGGCWSGSFGVFFGIVSAGEW